MLESSFVFIFLIVSWLVKLVVKRNIPYVAGQAEGTWIISIVELEYCYSIEISIFIVSIIYCMSMKGYCITLIHFYFQLKFDIYLYTLEITIIFIVLHRSKKCTSGLKRKKMISTNFGLKINLFILRLFTINKEIK